MHNDELIRLKDVTFHYPKGEEVLRGANLTIGMSERVGLTGPIGSGKTTVLHLIVGLIRPDGGSVEVLGRARTEEKHFWEVRERVGLLFQDPDDQLFCPTVREDIAFGPLNLGRTREQTEAAVRQSLARVGLEGFEDRITHHLSGGEKRLVSLATVLAMDPDVLLLDEPANGLDEASAERIRQLLLTLPQAMIVVSHDRSFLESVTTRIVRLEQGTIRE
jgi:cobalt/nickel transport system ATP-binding protein